MHNRRRFVRTLTGAAAGTWALGHGFVNLTAQAPTRRQVSIGGKRIKVIDIHSHCTVPEVGEVVKGTKFASNAGPQGGRALGRHRGHARRALRQRRRAHASSRVHRG